MWARCPHSDTHALPATHTCTHALPPQVLKRTADKHNTSISNVATRWVLQQPAVPAVIVGARNVLHVPEHVGLFAFALDDEDAAALQDVLSAGKRPKGDCYTWERGGVW